MDCFGTTHVGRRRPTNEDQFLIADLNKSIHVHRTSIGFDHQTRLFGNSQGKLLLVADGMGGHEAGERASMLAIDAVATYTLNMMRWFFRLDEQDEDDLVADLKQSLEHCQAAIQREIAAFPQRRGMGTTLTMVYIVWPRMYVVHVGDSRCYLHRGGKLTQITHDHTLAELHQGTQRRMPAGRAGHGLSHVLWNVIGGDDHQLVPEVHRATLQMGDAVLLCTDGLTRHVEDAELTGQLNARGTAEETCERLVAQANAAGGSDNITVVLARFQPPGEDTEVARAEQAIEVPSPADTVPLAT